ncbi:hypothetical protein [Deinococcus radiodurans]|uniref:hypothetical protein n=1 Tax=Deinococcus radiodurans TaxID=1299 RepID=UPI0013E8B85F|nr:hypothetical protein [Deinococcus radiodurans]
MGFSTIRHSRQDSRASIDGLSWKESLTEEKYVRVRILDDFGLRVYVGPGGADEELLFERTLESPCQKGIGLALSGTVKCTRFEPEDALALGENPLRPFIGMVTTTRQDSFRATLRTFEENVLEWDWEQHSCHTHAKDRDHITQAHLQMEELLWSPSALSGLLYEAVVKRLQSQERWGKGLFVGELNRCGAAFDLDGTPHSSAAFVMNGEFVMSPRGRLAQEGDTHGSSGHGGLSKPFLTDLYIGSYSCNPPLLPLIKAGVPFVESVHELSGDMFALDLSVFEEGNTTVANNIGSLVVGWRDEFSWLTFLNSLRWYGSLEHGVEAWISSWALSGPYTTYFQEWCF